MSVIAAAVKHLLAAGVTGDALVAAIADMEAMATAGGVTKDAAAERRREWDRNRRREQRATKRAALSTVSGGCPVDSADKADTDPSLDKEIPPRPPKEINPIPCVLDPRTRARVAFVGLAIIVAECRGKPDHRKPAKAPWPKGMPPPALVGSEQWAGFIAHRVAKREALTPRAYELLVAKLADHADDDDWPPGRIIDEIVDRGWLSFKTEWLHRNPGPRNAQRYDHDRRSGWAPRPGMEGVEPASLDDDEPRFVARH